MDRQQAEFCLLASLDFYMILSRLIDGDWEYMIDQVVAEELGL